MGFTGTWLEGGSFEDNDKAEGTLSRESSFCVLGWSVRSTHNVWVKSNQNMAVLV